MSIRSTPYAWGTTTLSDNVENLHLIAQGASVGIGNALGNIIVAGAYSATLDGGVGNDVLVGGKGADVFRVQAGNGSDAIVGFQSGWDAVDLKGYKFTSFDQVRANATQAGTDASIALGNGETLVLRDIKVASLTAADFGFSSVGSTVAAGLKSLVGPAAYAEANGVGVLNNTWGVGAMKYGTDFAIQTSYDAKNVAAGVTFNWSFANSTDVFQTVKAYPEIIFGVSPYGGATTWTDTAHSFPVQVNKIDGLTATFDTAIAGNTGGFNVSFDIWLTSKPFGDASTITNEIMVWTHKPANDALGTPVGTFNDGAHTGTIYHTGTYTAIVLDQDLPSGSLNISAVLGTLQKLGIVSSSEYLASVQFGSEVMNGVGSLTINNFAMSLQTTDDNGNAIIKEISGAGTTVVQVAAAAQSYAAVTAKLDGVTDSHGVITGYKSVASDSPKATTTTLYDTRGQAIGSDTVKIAGSTVTTEHHDAAHSLLSLDIATTAKNGAVTTKHYDAARKITGTDIATAANSAINTAHYDKNGVLTSNDLVRTAGTATTAEHYDGNWHRGSADFTASYAPGTGVTYRYDGNWQLLSSEEWSNANGVTTTKNFDAVHALTGGNETNVDVAGVTIKADYNSGWSLLDTVFTATAGDDVLTLKSGTNIVHGGAGSDVILAGTGADTFYFDTAIGKDVDKIVGFSASADSFVLDHHVFAGLGSSSVLASSAFTIGTAAQTTSNRIIYDDKTGDLYFDADGTESNAAVLFGHVDPHLALTGGQFHLI